MPNAGPILVPTASAVVRVTASRVECSVHHNRNTVIRGATCRCRAALVQPAAGMGIKGGIARKLLKEKYGKPEPPGAFDVDVLLFVQQYSPEVGTTRHDASDFKHARYLNFASCHFTSPIFLHPLHRPPRPCFSCQLTPNADPTASHSPMLPRVLTSLAPHLPRISPPSHLTSLAPQSPDARSLPHRLVARCVRP